MRRDLLRALNNSFEDQKLFRLSLSLNLSISLKSTRKNHTTNSDSEFFRIPGTIKWEPKPDGYTLVGMIRNCTNHGYISHGEQLHCYVIRSGFTSNVFISTAFVSFYAKLVSLDNAHKLFVEMPQPNVVTWNTIISGYVHSGDLYKALSFFLELNKSSIRADAYSFTTTLAACGQLSLLQLGMSIHSRIVICGLESSAVVSNCLIDMYGKCSSVENSVRVFDRLIDNKDVISWNSIIAASARNQRLDLTFNYFYQMPHPDTISYNELINGIAKFGNLDEAVEILRRMPDPNSSSWNAIISGYVVRNRAWEALDFFFQMHQNGVIMDEFTFSSILSGISGLSALTWGTLLHCCTLKHGLVASTIIGSALIDMYSKCGQVKDAELLFQSLPRKNIVSWNAMISGLAHNGESHKVVQYFEELKGVEGLRPDDITFVNVLAAYSHNQMPLEKAYEYFTSMINDYGIKPKPEHLGSMIRLMGHHGELRRAEKLIYELGFESCSSIWRALLGACEVCGNLEVAKVAVTKIIELKGVDEFGFVVLSNINRSRGNWVDGTAVWELMRDKGVVKEAGFSWTDGRNIVV